MGHQAALVNPAGGNFQHKCTWLQNSELVLSDEVATPEDVRLLPVPTTRTQQTIAGPCLRPGAFAVYFQCLGNIISRQLSHNQLFIATVVTVPI